MAVMGLFIWYLWALVLWEFCYCHACDSQVATILSCALMPTMGRLDVAALLLRFSPVAASMSVYVLALHHGKATVRYSTVSYSETTSWCKLHRATPYVLGLHKQMRFYLRSWMNSTREKWDFPGGFTSAWQSVP